MTEYPKRPPYFAHRFCRLLIKACAAQEIGHTGFVLCVTIAHTEDARRYSGPVTFFNEQLLPIVGVRKWEALDLARRKASEAGWLHYECQGKRQPGIYWVEIPEFAATFDDNPCGETPNALYPAKGDNTELLYPANGYRGGDREGDRQGYRAGDREGYRGGDPSCLSLDLSLDPNPKKEIPSESCTEPATPHSVPTGYVFPVTGKGKHTWTLPADELERYRAAFPGLDLDAQLRLAVRWCETNPGRRKTARGMLAFLTRWFGRVQDSGRTSGHAEAPVGMSAKEARSVEAGLRWLERTNHEK